MNYHDWLPIVQFAVQVLTLLVVPMVKREVSKLEKADEDNSQRIDQVEKSVNELKIEVSDNYVRKQDYAKTTGEMLKKLDEISKIVYEIKGELKGRER